MIARCRCGKLADALLTLLPGSEMAGTRETDWYSATFSGLRCEIDIRLTGENAAEQAEAFRATLPDHEFNLPRYIVADILVVQMLEEDAGVLLSIEALLLCE